MDNPIYPNITLGMVAPFQAVAVQAKRYKAFFGPQCPYDDDVKAFLKEYFSGRTVREAAVEAASFLEKGDDRHLALAGECVRVYQELEAFEAGLDVEDTTEKMAVLKTKVSLLEKLTTLQERNIGMKQLAEYQKTVLELIETILEPHQRTALIDRLKVLTGAAA